MVALHNCMHVSVHTFKTEVSWIIQSPAFPSLFYIFRNVS